MLIKTFSSTSPDLILKRHDATHKSEQPMRKQILQKLRFGTAPSRLREASRAHESLLGVWLTQ